MRRRHSWLIYLFLFLFTLSPLQAQVEIGCSEAGVHAVTTVGMIADVVRNVGQNCVAVTQMMGAGVDPHLYRATEGDVFTLLDADIIFYSGLNLEARLAEIFERMPDITPIVTIPVSEAIPEDMRLKEVGFDQTDPHVWMDVERWSYTVGAVREGLSAHDPEHSDFYAANADAYLVQLEALDQYIHDQMARVPVEQRVLITAHDAFQYYGNAYDIEVFAPQGITTSTEAGVEDIRRTIDLIASRDIPAVFVESSVPPDIVEAIIAGAEARGQTVRIGGSLYSDAMGATGTSEGTYIGMIRHNTDTIVSALLNEPSDSTND